MKAFALLTVALLGIALALAMLPALVCRSVDVAPPTTLAALRHGPLCYHWSEIYGDAARAHSGGLIFVLSGSRVFSTAWYTTAQPARAWPVVSGNGFVDGDSLEIAYRNATGDPAHAFYHAACRFTIDPKTRAFRCEFTQQAGPTGGISPGAARGEFVAAPGSEFDAYLPALLARAAAVEPPADAAHCPVLRENVGKPEYTLVYRGRTYRFCCPSCVNVFQARPEFFATPAAPVAAPLAAP